jgi:glycosyltransferase involved in cell wall biosynthesis
MKKILFLHSGKASLPEIAAYIDYFRKFNILGIDSKSILGRINFSEYDIIWEFMGTYGYPYRHAMVIHEYASMSVPPLPQVKNFIKKCINPKPNLRIFLNEEVKEGYNFNDGIDFCLRDMGINESFFIKNAVIKEYDMVYIGDVSRKRRLDIFLKSFVNQTKMSLCLIGSVDNKIYNNYKQQRNIIFAGKLSNNEVPNIASKATYGLNYIPDMYPYNKQTSTKLLEYLALDLKIISTDYEWVRSFENRFDCNFYKIGQTMNQSDFYRINNYCFKSGFMARAHSWEAIISKSGIPEEIFGFLSEKRKNNNV